MEPFLVFFGGRVDDVMQKDFRNYCFYTQFNCRYFIRTYFEPSIWTIILAMSITGWLGMSRVVRGEF